MKYFIFILLVLAVLVSASGSFAQVQDYWQDFQDRMRRDFDRQNVPPPDRDIMLERGRQAERESQRQRQMWENYRQEQERERRHQESMSNYNWQQRQNRRQWQNMYENPGQPYGY